MAEAIQYYYYDSLDSTNTQAKRLLQQNRSRSPICVCAKTQTAGRGSHYRPWCSPPDAGIYMSVGLGDLGDPGEHFLQLTIAAAQSCVEILGRHCALHIRLRGVNDLFVDEGKLGGVLTEATWQGNMLCYLVIGVGVNVSRAPRPLPDSAVQPVCLEQLLSGQAYRRLDIDRLVRAIAERLLDVTTELVASKTKVSM